MTQTNILSTLIIVKRNLEPPFPAIVEAVFLNENEGKVRPVVLPNAGFWSPFIPAGEATNGITICFMSDTQLRKEPSRPPESPVRELVGHEGVVVGRAATILPRV